MERVKKRPKYISSDLRASVRGSLDMIESRVPTEIWKTIFLHTNLKDLGSLAQCCKAFRALVEHMMGSDVGIAVRYIQAQQPRLAYRCFTACVNNGVPEALFRIAHTHENGTWEFDSEVLWNFRRLYGKAAVAGHPGGMIVYSKCLSMINPDPDCRWKKKALESGDPFALGYYHLMFLHNVEKAIEFFELAATTDEFAQFYLGLCYDYILKNYEKAMYWYLKATTRALKQSEQDEFAFMSKWKWPEGTTTINELLQLGQYKI